MRQKEEMSHGADKLAVIFAKIKDYITWMQSLIAFIDSCCRRWRSLIAPTSVCAVALIRKTQTKTAVGARISAMPKYVIASACGNYYLKALVFDYFSAISAAPYVKVASKRAKKHPVSA